MVLSRAIKRNATPSFNGHAGQKYTTRTGATLPAEANGQQPE